jgi:hypothetical protein
MSTLVAVDFTVSRRGSGPARKQRSGGGRDPTPRIRAAHFNTNPTTEYDFGARGQTVERKFHILSVDVFVSRSGESPCCSAPKRDHRVGR